MSDEQQGSVRFSGDDLSQVVALLRAHGTSAEDITAWIDVTPVDVSVELLPTKKGLLGRAKTAVPPSAQIIWVDPSVSGRGDSTINVELPGHDAEAVKTAMPPTPAGWRPEGGREGIIVNADVGVTPESLVQYAVAALGAALAGWNGRYEAVGFG